MIRPVHAVFANGRYPGPLALRPDAINVSYPTVDPEDMGYVVELVDGIAVMRIEGPLEHHMTWWTNYESIAIAFKAALESPLVSALVLKFDSPGGDCSGLNETVAALQRIKAESGKRVIAYVDESCYSAAYALAMACDEIYLPASGGVGSIGVITAMVDVTAANEAAGLRIEVIASGEQKTDGHPDVPLSDAAIGRTQGVVDTLAEAFFGIVSAARNIPIDDVRALEAGTYMGQAAVDIGLADAVMSLDECLTFAKNMFPLSNTNVEGTNMPALIAAAKAAEDAKKAAKAQALNASSPAAKVTKTKTVTTDTHEEEIDDGKEEAEFPEEEPSDDEPPPDDEEAPEEKAAASAALFALASKITGHKRASDVSAALRGMAASAKQNAVLTARVAKLEADAKARELSAIIASGIKAGKLTPGQRAWALTQSTSSLKAFLDAAPQLVRTVDDGETAAAPADALSERELAMCAEKKIDPVAYAKKKNEMFARNGRLSK